MVNLPRGTVPMKHHFIATKSVAVTLDGTQIETDRAKQWLEKLQAASINGHMDGPNVVGNPSFASAVEERCAHTPAPVLFANEDS
jgi:hypothetical protein